MLCKHTRKRLPAQLLRSSTIFRSLFLWGIILAILLTLPISIGANMNMQFTSSVFDHQGLIPKRYTYDGDDISPPLKWNRIPKEAQSLVLIVDDPNAPDPAALKITWVHWVLYDLPPDSGGMAEGVPSDELPSGAKEKLNDLKRTGYGGALSSDR